MEKKMRIKIGPIITAIAAFLMAGLTFSPLQAQTGVYTLDGGTTSESGQTYEATGTDESPVYVLNSGNLTLTDCIMIKTGDASSVDNASKYGINAGVLAASSGDVTISGGSVTTNALGGNGLFATGSGSTISMSNGTINASGGGAHGVDVTYGGSITLINVDVTTTGSSSSALATDFGGGTVTVTGGTIVAANTETNGHSAGIYSTGVITVNDANVSSLGDCGGVIDGANSIILNNTSLTGLVEGIKIWKTAPASGAAVVTIENGSLSSTNGDAFYVTGETGNAATADLSVSDSATISAGSGNIVNVVSSSTAAFTADGATLSGNMYADATSTLEVQLQNGASLTGSAENSSLTIDAASSWTLTANSTLTELIDPDGISDLNVTNIIGNGYSAHYDSSLAANDYLEGKIYSLFNGGVLTPGDFESYTCGDANSDGVVNVSDAVRIINYVFIGGSAPDPLESGDANCDEVVNVSDAVWIINFVFIGGNSPCDTDGDDIADC